MDKTAYSFEKPHLLEPFPDSNQQNIEQHIEKLKKILTQGISDHIASINTYLAQLEYRQQGSLVKHQSRCIIQYIVLLQKRRLETELPPKLFQSTMSELVDLTFFEMTAIQSQLTAKDRHNYQRIANFNKDMMYKFESKVKYPQQVYSIKGMIHFNVMALFYWKNYRYRQMHGIQSLIPPRIFMTLLNIKNVEFKRFQERFQDAFDFIDLKFINQLEPLIKTYCLVQLKHKLIYYQRIKLKCKKIFQTKKRKQIKWTQQSKHKDFTFQYCQIVLFPPLSKKTSQKKDIKVQEQITKEMQQISFLTDNDLVKSRLLKIKTERYLSLRATVQLYRIVCLNPERKITLTLDEKRQLYTQLEEIKWVYFTRNTASDSRLKNSQNFSFHFLEKKLINQLSPSAIIAFWIAMERYKLVQKVNTWLLKIIKMQKYPTIFIYRHSFSFGKIKRANRDSQSFINSQDKRHDIVFTHVLGIQKDQVDFSALVKGQLNDIAYSHFLLDLGQSKRKICEEKVVLYQFQHNRQVSWEAILIILKGFKMKMSADIIYSNNLKQFILHFFINLSIQWLLRQKTDFLTRDNFQINLKNVRTQVLSAIIKDSGAISQILNEDIEAYQIFCASKITHLLHALIKDDKSGYILDKIDYFHGENQVQCIIQPSKWPNEHQKDIFVGHFQPISLEMINNMKNYIQNQLKKKYMYLDDFDKDQQSTSFSILLQKYAMNTTHVNNILSKCSKFILISQAVLNQILIAGKSENGKENKEQQFLETVQSLKKIIQLQKSKIDLMFPGERLNFIKKSLCLSKYLITKQQLKNNQLVAS